MDIEEQLKQAYLDGSRDCYESMFKIFHYDEFTNIITFYGVKFTVEVLDDISNLFSLKQIIECARTKKPARAILYDFEYKLTINNNNAKIEKKDLNEYLD